MLIMIWIAKAKTSKAIINNAKMSKMLASAVAQLLLCNQPHSHDYKAKKLCRFLIIYTSDIRVKADIM